MLNYLAIFDIFCNCFIIFDENFSINLSQHSYKLETIDQEFSLYLKIHCYAAMAHGHMLLYAKQKNCDHKWLINNKVRVIDKVYHIQTVNGAIANFKGGVNGKMKGVTTKYLSNYLVWYRESNTKLDKQQILIAAYG